MPLATPESLQTYDRFLAEAGPDRLQKILARYELFKMASTVPGDIVECGVFKGSGVYLWAKLLCLFAPLSERRVVGFDFFDADRSIDFARADDQTVLDEHAEGWTQTGEIVDRVTAMGLDAERIELVAGDVCRTTAEYVRANTGFRISLLHLDVDNYEGTKAILENLYPCVTPGGVVVFDEYGLRTYGEADAVDEFFGPGVRLQTIPWANTPTAYVVKGDERR